MVAAPALTWNTYSDPVLLPAELAPKSSWFAVGSQLLPFSANTDGTDPAALSGDSNTAPAQKEPSSLRDVTTVKTDPSGPGAVPARTVSLSWA